MSYRGDGAEEAKETHSVSRGKRRVTGEKRKGKGEMREEEEHIRKLFGGMQKSFFWRKEEKLSEFRDFGRVRTVDMDGRKRAVREGVLFLRVSFVV